MNLYITTFAILAVCYTSLGASVQSRSSSYCYSADLVKPQTAHFTSKTAYQVAKGTNFAQYASVPNCKPVKFWLVSRHGTRLPEVDQIEALPDLEGLRNNIIDNFKNPVDGGLCPGDLALIKNWVLDRNITIDKEQYLTIQGWNDLKGMAQDYKTAFPSLLSTYDESKFLFRHTNTQRTEASYKAFVEGLFGVNAHLRVKLTQPVGDDTLLQPFNYCPTWVSNQDDKKGTETEGGKFKASDTMTQTLARMSARLGFTKTLKYKKAKLMWDACRFESAWFVNKPSPWCSAFTMDDVRVFEYLDDLGKDFSCGYANNINRNIACEVVQDLLKRMNSDEEPRVVAYFSHSALIQLIANALGLFKDSNPLQSANFASMNNRQWRISELDPFAANYAVVKYDCSANKQDPSPKVKFFSNQKPLQIDGCSNGICKLTDLIQKYGKFMNENCMNTFCNA